MRLTNTKTRNRHPNPGKRPTHAFRTRAKLLETAGEVFAERGYQAATVREICTRAGVNIALVNYHFGDKMGLYTEVLRQSVRAAQLRDVWASVDPNSPPEEFIRRLIRDRVETICGLDRPSWHLRLVYHEFTQPTPAMARVVNEAIRPVYDRLRGLLGGMLGLPPGDQKTRLCVHSIMGQILFYAFARPVLERLWPELKMTPEQRVKIADHIAEFSLAYLEGANAAHESATPMAGVRRRK